MLVPSKTRTGSHVFFKSLDSEIFHIKVTLVGIQMWLAQWPACTPTRVFKGTNLLK